MIVIGKTMVSDEVVEKQFVCALHHCKGACCVEGDAGAPLEFIETTELEKIFPAVKPFMEKEGVASVEKYGPWVVDSEGEFVTPLVDGVKQCAYVYFEKGIAKCAIEKAHEENKIDFHKPISCHLYPVRIKKHEEYDAVNYNYWEICSPACKNGEALKVPVFQFVKKALIRKYGNEWFQQLEEAAIFAEQKK
jgi:hypothetical protein